MEKYFIYNGEKISYTFEYKRVKNINLRVRREGSVYVSAPRRVPFDRVEEFVLSKAPFIIAAQERLKATPVLKAELTDGGDCFFLGKRYTLRIAQGSVRIDSDVIYAPSISAYEKWERDMAQKIILPMCREKYPLFESCCKSFPEIKFRKMTAKWGVCRPTAGRITFNTHLVRHPLSCIEYVICHEFVHFKHPDHSKNFYAELSRILPDWRERKKQLNK